MTERKMRSSQVVVPFGVGAIVDFPDESLMTCSIDYWQGGETIYDERLKRRLSGYGIRSFRKPPIVEEGEPIPFVRFPRWMFCPHCRDFKPVEEWSKEYLGKQKKNYNVPRCSKCNSKLVPARFVVACSEGHIEDFPWIEWTHKSTSICSSPKLKITTGTGSSGLSGIKVECTTCNSSETMNRAFSKGELDKIKKCSGSKPWERGKHEKCGNFLTTLQRGGSNVYFPNLISSIYIPEENTKVEEKIKESNGWKVLNRDVDPGNNADFINWIIEDIAKEINYNIDKVRKCVSKMISTKYEDAEDVGEVLYRFDEYVAFTGEKDIDQKSADFIIEKVDSDKYNFAFIDKVILAHKIREIRALLNFTRLKPLDTYEYEGERESEEESFENKIIPKYVSNDLRSRGWLPAIETKGEGIFLKFNANILDEWSNQKDVLERANIINERYRNVVRERGGRVRVITPEFLMLHTFSHLLIRQLSFEAGYSSASLKEKIYCNETEAQPSMEGILIYTASSDSDGTLGGLVREGRPDFFPSIVQNCIEKAEWCSSDPLCQESTGQGLDSLNLSACHACVLLPETSCEERNRFLDRVLLTGKINNPEIGFFNFIKNYL